MVNVDDNERHGPDGGGAWGHQQPVNGSIACPSSNAIQIPGWRFCAGPDLKK